MAKQYILFKLHLNEVIYKRYDSLEELKGDHKSNPDFPGEVSAEYDLEEKKYLYLRNLHGEGGILQPSLDLAIATYLTEAEE